MRIHDETTARVALCALHDLRDADRLALLRRFGSAQEALAAGGSTLGSACASQLRSRRFQRRVEAALATIRALDVNVLTPVDAAFPTLAEPLEPPPVLFCRGDIALLRRHCVAVVGTRRSTEYGEDVASDLAAALARAGVVVMSGLARGIDGVAHRSAIAAGGATAAVLGCGIDVEYPREHAELQEEVATTGLLMSEFLPGESPRPYWFLQRNRLIAGWSAATVVVEGGVTSGAINTAHHALRANLHVFGVPGPLGRGTSEGPNALVRDGALLYTEPLDVLLAVGVAARADAGRATDEDVSMPPDPVIGTAIQLGLRREALHIDVIAAIAAVPAADVLARLLELEIDGCVEQLPGMRFRLTRSAAQALAPASAKATVPAEAGISAS